MYGFSSAKARIQWRSKRVRGWKREFARVSKRVAGVEWGKEHLKRVERRVGSYEDHISRVSWLMKPIVSRGWKWFNYLRWMRGVEVGDSRRTSFLLTLLVRQTVCESSPGSSFIPSTLPGKRYVGLFLVDHFFIMTSRLDQYVLSY